MSLAGPPQADKRVVALRWRTVGTGFLAAALMVLGVLASVVSLASLGRLLAADAKVGIPALHVPAAMRDAGGLPLFSIVFYGLGILAVWGMSTGRIRRRHVQLSLVLMLIVGALDWLGAAPLHNPLFALSSKLERLVDAGELARADEVVLAATSPITRVRTDYVRAQLALRTADQALLRRLATPILADVDAFVYRESPEPDAAFLLNEAIGDLRLDVLAAFDRHLNGEPVTSAGLAQGDEIAPAWSGRSLAAVKTLAALAVLGVGLLSLRLWRTMRARLLTIIDLRV